MVEGNGNQGGSYPYKLDRERPVKYCTFIVAINETNLALGGFRVVSKSGDRDRAHVERVNKFVVDRILGKYPDLLLILEAFLENNINVLRDRFPEIGNIDELSLPRIR